MRNCSSNNSSAAPIPEKESAAVPEKESTASIRARIKSLILNNFLASPDFPRLYAALAASEGYNPNQARILAEKYQVIFNRTNMPIHPNVKICTHIKVTGIRCGSPALRGEQFCYFHQRMVRGVRTPPQARLHPIALIEDEESIQAALMEVINALARNTIDLKRAALILRALHIAVKNARRVRFEEDHSSMVKEAPAYPDAATANVGTAAPGCPSGPDLPSRTATGTAAAHFTEFDFPPLPPAPQTHHREASFDEQSFMENWKAGKEELDRPALARAQGAQ